MQEPDQSTMFGLNVRREEVRSVQTHSATSGNSVLAFIVGGLSSPSPSWQVLYQGAQPAMGQPDVQHEPSKGVAVEGKIIPPADGG